METKARRDAQVRALARLLAQARLNAGEAHQLRRVQERDAWRVVAGVLENLITQTRAGEGLHVQMTLWERTGGWYEDAFGETPS